MPKEAAGVYVHVLLAFVMGCHGHGSPGESSAVTTEASAAGSSTGIAPAPPPSFPVVVAEGSGVVAPSASPDSADPCLGAQTILIDEVVDSPHAAATQSHVDIMRWGEKTSAFVKRIRLSTEGGPYAVTNVEAFARDRFVYRIYDEHEYRYYDQDGRKFSSGRGPGANWDGPGSLHKEQFDLAVSPDRHFAAFTERNWNELTYLVVMDLASRKRITTRFYGSAPGIYGDYVAFMSDPKFVRGGNLAFRQIKTYAVYAYHVPTGTLCEVAQYAGVVQVH
jgi:hypothetical protein